MECEIILNPEQISVTLDQEDKQALQNIADMLGQAGLLAGLLSAAHVLSWMDKEVGMVTVGTEDWLGLAKTIANSNRLVLIGVQKAAAAQYSRHFTRGTHEQARFWANFQSIVTRVIKGQCK
ncbi:MAG: hypothetical protein SV765_12260 [Pseudomonadota bacterium]|mgnify:FL=1|nr:hypothetical protein [Pseudomonadota bacterium]